MNGVVPVLNHCVAISSCPANHSEGAPRFGIAAFEGIGGVPAAGRHGHAARGRQRNSAASGAAGRSAEEALQTGSAGSSHLSPAGKPIKNP